MVNPRTTCNWDSPFFGDPKGQEIRRRMSEEYEIASNHSESNGTAAGPSDVETGSSSRVLPPTAIPQHPPTISFVDHPQKRNPPSVSFSLHDRRKKEAARQIAAAKAEARYKRLKKVKDFCVKRTLLIVITLASFAGAAFLVVMGLNAQHQQKLREIGGNVATTDKQVASVAATAAPSSLQQVPPVNNNLASGVAANNNVLQVAGPSTLAADSSLAVNNLVGANSSAISNVGVVGGGATTNNVVTPGSQGQLEKNSLVVDQSQSVLTGETVAQNKAVSDKPMDLVELSECPEKEGLQLYPHPKYCDQFYKCVNGTISLEFCENGLLFDSKGAVHNYCNYHWAVDCGKRVNEITEIKSPGCPYRFGIFPKDSKECATSYYKCAFGIPQELPCEPGLAYDNRIHQCNWPDLTPKCDPETIVGFECPEKLPPGSLAVKFMPFPRFDAGRCDSLIVCVNGYPRLIRCTEEKVFNKVTLSCDYPENVPECASHQSVREQQSR